MGHVHVDALVQGTKVARTVRFLVDTGATYTIISQALADELGIDVLPDYTLTLSLADSSEVEAAVGTLGIELHGRRGAMTTAVLAGDGEPLLGVEALEALGLRVNPTSGTVEPTRARAGLLVGARPRRRR